MNRIRHILSPLAREGGRIPLCGKQDDGSAYDGLDEAYRAQLEHWDDSFVCKNCLDVAALGLNERPL